MRIIRANEVTEKDRGTYRVREYGGLEFHEAIRDSVWFMTTIPQGSPFEEQWHKKSSEAFYFLSKGIALVDRRRYEVDEGDLMIIGPNEKHEFVPAFGDFKMLAVRFPNLPNDKYTGRKPE